MNYEKKYKEALELARVAAFNGHQSLMEGIFPELKESEDERISKEIIKYLEQTVPHHHRDEVLKSKEWIAWLEKQGEQKVSYTTIVETGNGGINALVTRELHTNGCDEQKPAWSEEDQNALEDVREAIVHYWGGETQDILLYWLKSIKQRIRKETA